MQKIVFKHLSGSRREQVDSFPAGDYELIVGRDPAAHVRFDQDRDDLVSRQHLKIVRDPWDANAFQLVDLQSRNGTFLNRQRVTGSTRLNHNDVIQLGAGGPEFRFEIDPPPVQTSAVRETTVAFAGGPAVKPTRESWLPDPPGKPQPVGRGTVERMLGDVFTRVKRQSNRRVWLVGGAAIAAVLLLGAGTYSFLRRSQTQIQSQIQSDLSTAQSQNQEALARVQQEADKSGEAAKEVARLQSELEASNQRNDANHRALMAELEKARKEQAAQASALERTRRDAAAQTAALEKILKQQQSSPPSAPAPAAEIADPAKYEDLRRQAEAKFDQDPAAAQELADKLMQADPRRWEGYALAARIAAMRGDFRRASDMYQRAVDRAPADVRAGLEKQLEVTRNLIQP